MAANLSAGQLFLRFGGRTSRHKNSHAKEVAIRSSGTIIKPVETSGYIPVPTCHLDADAHSFGIIYASKIGIGVAGSGGCPEPARTRRRESPVILRRPSAELKFYNGFPASTEDVTYTPQLSKIDHRRAPVAQHLVELGHAACQVDERRRGQKRKMRIQPARAQAGKGVKPLHHAAERAMLDHQYSFQSSVLRHTLSTANFANHAMRHEDRLLSCLGPSIE